MHKKALVWEEVIKLPSYGIGQPEKNPIFLEKRVYQGSSGAVYPYPVVEKIEDNIELKEYNAVWLENEYIKIMVLPQLGGRIQMAYDKLKKRHFIYYNQVIKPALVGLTGPWISGGIEFNWPQHHRPSTFLPVDYTLEEREDGSAAVWVGERERMFHQKGAAAFILRPGKAFLEIQGKLYNPTPFPQTFLWWANPAVAVNEHYQSVFPVDVHAVFDHGKRDVSKYPIATGVYYKADYSAGVDISRYKNIPVPTSYMAVRSEYDFVGGYENDTQAGLLHVANHHIAPGKKQWTWGNGDFGKAWDRNLTDEDGPYIELMTGVFTDNQPDFTWLQPYEEKAFTQYFIPYREVGVVKNASADLLMNLELQNGIPVLKLMSTSLQEKLSINVYYKQNLCFETIETLSPEQVYQSEMPIPEIQFSTVCITDSNGTLLLEWEAPIEATKETPEAARPALLPNEISSIEQLFLTGQHLEQYRHATYSPVDYYKEALARESSDIRCNNAMGLWLLRKGQFLQAEEYLRKAVATQTERNPNPYDGEPLYNLGITLKYEGQLAEAYSCFYKSCWNAAWQDVGYFSLAQLSCISGLWQRALEEVDRSLIRNWHNHRARHLKTLILRKLGRKQETEKFIRESLEVDVFNFGCLFEKYLLNKDRAVLELISKRMCQGAHNYEELAQDYADAGCWTEALEVVQMAVEYNAQETPMLYYYKAWFLSNLHKGKEALECIERAEKVNPDVFFPNHLNALLALQTVVKLCPSASKAYYLLGNIWYDKRQYNEAIDAWEKSVKLDESFPTVLRNLSLAYFNKLQRKEAARILLEKAFLLDQTDARILMELDQLYKRLNLPYQQRITRLEEHRETTLSRDDLYLEYVTLLNLSGRYAEALQLIDRHKFHPWEGGEGKVPEQYQQARLGLVRQALDRRRYDEALQWIEECYNYPQHLGEGKLPGTCENDLDYYKAYLYDKMEQFEKVKAYWGKAAQGKLELGAAMYYNDQKPDKVFYQGLALDKMGQTDKARLVFKSLINYGEKHLSDTFKMDYFAVSLPDLQIWEDDMDKKNQIQCYYLIGLGYIGLKQYDKAQDYLDKAAQLNIYHQGVAVHRTILAWLHTSSECLM